MISCPACLSFEVDEVLRLGTLVYYMGEDLNTYTITCKCKSCGNDFSYSKKGGKIWYNNSDKRREQ